MKRILFLLYFTLLINNLNAQYCHLKGVHQSVPFKVESMRNPVFLTVKFKFNETNKYIYNDVDQYDFNKLFGFKGKFFTPRYDAVMVGWRYNPTIDKFQIVPYFHSGGPAYIFDESSALNVDLNEECVCIITIENKNVKMILRNSTSELVKTIEFAERYSRLWKIVPWYGGNRTAPHKMKMDIQNF